MESKLIPLAEYARRHCLMENAARRKAAQGGFKTAVKVGRVWLIDENEPCMDRRVKHGKYKEWRKKNG